MVLFDHGKNNLGPASIQALDKFDGEIKKVLPKTTVEIRQSHTPGFTDSRVSPGERNLLEVPNPLEEMKIGQKNLSPPNRAVCPVTGPVHGKANHRA